MKKALLMLTACLLLTLCLQVALAEEEVFALPAEQVIEEVALTLGEEPVLPAIQADDEISVSEPVLTAADDGEGSEPAEGLIDRVVTISLKPGVEITKVYDKTRNVSISSASFQINNVDTAIGDRVRISRILAAYDSPKAGARTVTFGFEITQTSSTYNYILDPATITVPATITPKTLTITPTTDQSKTYGEANPSIYNATINGLMNDDLFSGRLSREPGEDVGSYRITLGTFTARSSFDDAGESSYVIDLKEGYFTILPKSIEGSGFIMTQLGKYAYTGSAIEPPISMMDVDLPLAQGLDYEVTYSNNVNSGVATATVTGIGNYTGTRTALFRIYHDGYDVPFRLPEGTKHIGAEAFAGIAPMEVILTVGCESIGRRAFADCPWLESIFIPGSVNTIDDTAFENCANLVITTDSQTIKDWADAHGFTCHTTPSGPAPGPF